MISGIPTRQDIFNILNSELYNSQKRYNDLFLEKNSEKLSDYKNKWVSNPLWQWSRIYEYPFTESHINEFIKGRNDIRILDAGSGITFLPFMLSEKPEISEINCLDYDKSLIKTYNEIGSDKIKFNNGSLNLLEFNDNTFDIIYCISVLEHTDNYEKILLEFKRVIKNDGLLILTFDIGLSHQHKLNLENSNRLINLVNETIINKNDQLTTINSFGKNNWTTEKAFKYNKKLLPYPRKSFFGKLKNRMQGKRDFPHLTFYVLSTKVSK
jgi:ubiquinone/menaquinone biosynthesis C-methylase UbiE